jgi:hypothetical protein
MRILRDIGQERDIVAVLTALLSVYAGVIASCFSKGALWISDPFGQVEIIDLQKILINVSIAGRAADAKLFRVGGIDMAESLLLISDQRSDDLIDVINALRACPDLSATAVQLLLIDALCLLRRISILAMAAVSQIRTAVADPWCFDNSGA